MRRRLARSGDRPKSVLGFAREIFWKGSGHLPSLAPRLLWIFLSGDRLKSAAADRDAQAAVDTGKRGEPCFAAARSTYKSLHHRGSICCAVCRRRSQGMAAGPRLVASSRGGLEEVPAARGRWMGTSDDLVASAGRSGLRARVGLVPASCGPTWDGSSKRRCVAAQAAASTAAGRRRRFFAKKICPTAYLPQGSGWRFR
jgi:hypothetical protein